MPNKNYRISHELPKGFVSPLSTKINNIKKFVWLKPSPSIEKEEEFKTYKNSSFKLTRNSKFNHYNNYFQENRLKVFKIWEGIR